MKAIVVEPVPISKEERDKIAALIEICDDPAIVNRKLLDKGLLAAGANEFRYIPFQEKDWICLARFAPVAVAGEQSRVIMRLPAHLGDLAKSFFISFIDNQRQKYSDDGALTIGSFNRTGENN